MATNAFASRIAVKDIKLVNYVPSDAGWAKMWTSYSHDRTAADLAGIASLGANAVRLAVNAWAVGYPVVASTQAANLKDFMDTAKSLGLSVQLTLFDSFFTFSDVAGSEAWLHSLLDSYAGDNQIAMVEVHNELDPSNDAGLIWAKQLLDYLPTVLPNVPRTASFFGTIQTPQNQANYNSLMASTDVIDIHLYGWLAQMSARLTAASAIANGRPIFVGEAGAPTGQTASAAGDAGQVSQYQLTYQLCQAYGIPFFSPWNYTDLVAGTVPVALEGTDELSYGLRRTDGTWKPAAAFVRQMFGAAPVATPIPTPTPAPASGSGQGASTTTGTGAPAPTATPVPVPAAPMVALGDFSFENEADKVIRGGSLGSWIVVNGGNATAIGSVAGQGVNASRAGYITGSHGDPSMSPALMEAFITPVSSKTISVSAMVRGANATGETWISICWFNGVNFISSMGSKPLNTGSSAWQQLAVTATRPANADTAQVMLRSRNNNGTVYWDSFSEVLS